jgi:hypothetical protein
MIVRDNDGTKKRERVCVPISTMTVLGFVRLRASVNHDVYSNATRPTETMASRNKTITITIQLTSKY